MKTFGTKVDGIVPSNFAYIPKKKLIEYWQPNHSWTLTSSAGSSISADLTNFRTGKQAIRLTTTPTYQACSIDKNIIVDLLNKCLEIDMYIEDVSKLSLIYATLSPTTVFINYFVGTFPVENLKNVWNTLSFIINLFNKLGGTPPKVEDLANIKLIRLKIETKSVSDNREVSVTLDRMQIVDNPFSRAKVVLRFDDGHNTVYSEAKPAMDKYGFRGVVYAITSQHESSMPNRMTMVELYTLQNLGWVIASHTVNHLDLSLPSLTKEELSIILQNQKNGCLIRDS